MAEGLNEEEKEEEVWFGGGGEVVGCLLVIGAQLSLTGEQGSREIDRRAWLGERSS